MPKSTTGFTLIETLVYITLFGIIMGGFLSITYQIISMSNTASQKIAVLEETHFLLKKISYYIDRAEEIISPREGQTTSLFTWKERTSLFELGFDSTEKNITFKKDTLPVLILNTEAIKFQNIEFIRTSGRLEAKITTNNETYQLIRHINE